MSSSTSIADKESITLFRYLFASFDALKDGVNYITQKVAGPESTPLNQRGYDQSVSDKVLSASGLTPIATRRILAPTGSLPPQISARTTAGPSKIESTTPLKVKNGSKLTPALISEVATGPATASIAQFPSLLLGSEGASYGSSSSSYAEYVDKTYNIDSSSSSALMSPIIVRPGGSSSFARPVIGSSSSSARPVIGSSSSSARPAIGSSSSSAQPVIGSSSSSAQPTIGSSSSSDQPTIGSSSSSAQPVIGSSSSSARPIIGSSSSSARSAIGSSSSSARPIIGSSSSSARSAIGSSSSSQTVTTSCYIPDNLIRTSNIGRTYSLSGGACNITFSVLLYVSSAPHYCPDGKTLNSAYGPSTKEQETYRTVLKSFITSGCYNFAIDFLYYHAIENGLMSPPVAVYSQSRFDTFSLLSNTFIQYIILNYNINKESNTAIIDTDKNSKIIEWFDKLNSTYTDPYKSRTGNGYYLYTLKQLAYMYIKRAPRTSYSDITDKLTTYFRNVNSVSLSATNYSSEVPEIQILSGAKTVPLINTNNTPVLDSNGNPETITVVFNNDYFIKGEYRANRSIHYHDYHLRLLFSTLIMLKLMNTEKAFFDDIKSSILSILTTLRKQNAIDLYTVWSGGYKPDVFTLSSVNTTYNEYQFIFEDVPMNPHTLMMYSVNSKDLIDAVRYTNSVIGSSSSSR
jgi:hypothetical protein